MPVDIIEMLWGCTVCKAENRGRDKTCSNCGAPRTDDSPEWMPGDISHAAAVTDEKLLEKFEAGPDWKCKYCGSSQFRADGKCAQCGSSQDESEVPEGEPYRAKRKTTPEPEEHDCPDDDCPFNNLTSESVTRSKTRRGVAIAAILVPVIAICAYFIFRTKIIDASVSTFAWQRSVKVERYQVWQREGWSSDPGAFDVRDQGRRIHHYEHVRVGSHEESYPEQYQCGQDCRTVPGSCRTTPRSCTSNKNGSATCTGGDTICSPSTQSCSPRYCTRTAHRTVDDYEDQPRYQDWYTWKVWDWGFNRDVRAQGNTTEVFWPPPSQVRMNEGLAPGEKEREAGRAESFKITFYSGDDKKTYDYAPTTEAEFKSFHHGERVKLKVGVAHGVEVLRRVPDQS